MLSVVVVSCILTFLVSDVPLTENVRLPTRWLICLKLIT